MAGILDQIQDAAHTAKRNRGAGQSHSAQAPDLSRFSWHTGGPLRRLSDIDCCPPLYRDLGLDAMHRFLAGNLTWLCGPLSPVTYMRSADYDEPYEDHGRIGRVMLLKPEMIGVWRSGVDNVYVAPRDLKIDFQSMLFLPDEIGFMEAEKRFMGADSTNDVIQDIGEDAYTELVRESWNRVDQLRASHQKTEQVLSPLRKLFQSSCQPERDFARELMARFEISETDLCSAWHHLPEERRRQMQSLIPEVQEQLTGGPV